MEISANAKINLTLDILRRREDGYHDLQMVMQSVSLADELTVTPAQGGVGTAVSDLHFLPTGGKNLAQMAAAAFRQAVGAGVCLWQPFARRCARVFWRKAIWKRRGPVTMG